MDKREIRVQEAALLARFRDGDEEAFRVLLERYGTVLTRKIRRQLPRGLRRRVTIADVLQDACLAAYQVRDRLETDDADGFRRWLLAIVDNKVKETVRFHAGTAQRALGREITRTRRPTTRSVHGRGPTPSAVAIGRETHDRLRAALQQLPDDYREIIRLTREEHLTLRVAGERMGRSREAAKKLYARAMRRLQECMDNDEEVRGE